MPFDETVPENKRLFLKIYTLEKEGREGESLVLESTDIACGGENHLKILNCP